MSGGWGDRLGCSTISFRFRPLEEALSLIARAGFREIDLGALPGICDHVPVPLEPGTAAVVARTVRAAGLRVRTINADISPLNDLELEPKRVLEMTRPLLDLANEIGSPTLMLPCGGPDRAPKVDLATDLGVLVDRLEMLAAAASQQGVRLLVEAPHVRRLCHTTQLADQLLARLPAEVAGLVLDASHVQASGGDPAGWFASVAERVEHIQLRDATVGDINRSIGRGDIEFPRIFAAAGTSGYNASYTLELETHDVDEADREREVRRARGQVLSWQGRIKDR